MSEWIECGLVWDYIPVSYASPDLSSREKEVFGTTYLEECDKYNEIETHILSIYLVDSMNTYLKSLNDPKIDEYLEFDKWRDSYFEWYHQQPEIINFKTLLAW